MAAEPDHDLPLLTEEQALSLALPWAEVDPDDPAQVLREYLRCLADPVYFIRRYVQVTSGDTTMPFALWPWQAALIEAWQNESLTIVLKSRQVGVSELAHAYALWRARFFDSQRILIVSKTQPAAEDLLRRLQFAYAHLPSWLQARNERGLPEPPDTCYLSKQTGSAFIFDHMDKQGHASPSLIRSLPATKSTGRSASATLVILDEWAYQQFDYEIWTAIAPTVANGGRLVGISTANGMRGVFYEMWVAAMRGDNDFFPVFIPWAAHPDRDDAWYQKQSRQYEQAKLHQEYPREPTEAFISSGNPVFDPVYINRIAQEIEDERLTPLEQTSGLTVYEAPDPAHSYVIGADVAEGMLKGDWSAAVVIDRQTWRQVAELRGKWEPEEYAKLLWRLGERYGTAGLPALLAVERNNHGHAVLQALRSPFTELFVNADRPTPPTSSMGLSALTGYGHLFFQADATVPGASPILRAGWHTNRMTKPMAIDALAKALREGLYHPRSNAFVYECRSFVRDETGQKMGAIGGVAGKAHDDLVMATSIAVWILAQPDAPAQALSYLQRMHELVTARLQEHEIEHARTQAQPAYQGRDLTLLHPGPVLVSPLPAPVSPVITGPVVDAD